jgi:hypothetical protein
MCVVVAAEHPFIKSLQSNDHSIWVTAVREPVAHSSLSKHVKPTIQVLGVPANPRVALVGEKQ